MPDPLDCLIIGGGPAGLTAATYLGRYRRKALLVDAGQSRCSLIPISHNFPAWPEGISGIEILTRMREQASRYGTAIENGYVESLSQRDGLFEARVGGETLLARTVILATGVVDNQPNLPNADYAVRQGLIRLCPICDAYELIDKNVAIFGRGAHGLLEALFLRHYTPHVSLVTLGHDPGLDAGQLDQLKAAEIPLISEAIEIVELDQEAKRVICLQSKSGKSWTFDTLYSALGTEVRAELAEPLGVEQSDCGALIVDGHQLTRIDGLYAIGDMVEGLNQISVATGQAAQAATHVHNRLRGLGWL